MTRAREKLVLVGTARNVDGVLTRKSGRARSRGDGVFTGDSVATGDGVSAGDSPSGGPALLEIITANTPLDWLIPAFPPSRGLQPARSSVIPSNREPQSARPPVVEIHTHAPDTMSTWTTTKPDDVARNIMLEAAATCDPLPPDEPMAPDDPQVERVLARMDYVYPHLASASVRAAVGASEFKGAHDFTKDPDMRDERAPGGEEFELPWVVGDDDATADARPRELKSAGRGDDGGSRGLKPAAREGAARRGVVMHRVLQFMDFRQAMDADGVARELLRMTTDGLLAAEEVDALDRVGIEWFVTTPLAAAIRDAGDRYRREFPYIATESPEHFDPTVGSLPDDSVLVRGIVDGILPVGGGIEIVDFKTDAVDRDGLTERRDGLAERTERYRPQMAMYARAMAKIWRRPVTACRLVFLSVREIVALDGATDA